MNRSHWHPKAHAALAAYSDKEIPRSREALLAISGIGPKTVDAILSSLAVAQAPAAPGAAAQGAGPVLPPAAAPPPAAVASNGRCRAMLYPAAAALFPKLLDAANGNAEYAAQAALDTAEQMGAADALVGERAFRLLEGYCQSGRIPTEDDGRELVRLVRAAGAELAHPTPSPFANEPPGDELGQGV